MKKENILICVIFLISLALRLFELNFQSLYLDEIANLIIFSHADSLSKVWDNLSVHPYVPFNYFLMFFINKIISFTELNIRYVSIFWGMGALLVSWFLSKEFIKSFSLRVGFLISMSFSYQMIYFAQTYIPYAMLMCLTCLGTYLLLEYQKTKSKKLLLFYVLISAFMVGSHLLAVVLVFAQGMGWLYYAYRNKGQLKIWIGVYLLLFLSFLPWLEKARALNTAQDLYSVGLLDLPRYYYRLFKSPLLGVLGALIFFKGLVFDKFKMKEGLRDNEVLIFCVAVIPVVLLFLKSLVATSSFQFRYISMSLPIIYLLHFYALDRTELGSKSKMTILSVFVLLSAFVLKQREYYTTPFKMDYRSMAEKVSALEESLPIVCNDFLPDYANFYLNPKKRKCDFHFQKDGTPNGRFIFIETDHFDSGLRKKFSVINSYDVFRVNVSVLEPIQE